MPYFRRASHVFLLVGATVFTYGVGGLVYWLAKRSAKICPDCGLDWKRAALAPTRWSTRGEEEAPSAALAGTASNLPGDGLARRISGVVLLLTSLLLVLLGATGLASQVLLPVGATVGGLGALTFWWGWSSMQARREELMRRLQGRVLELADREGGGLTASGVARTLNLSLTAAERILVSMEDGVRVRSDVTSEGLILFEFPELVRDRGESLPEGTEVELEGAGEE